MAAGNFTSADRLQRGAVKYTVAVRALCEFTAREGDLDMRFTPAPSAQEGRDGHIVVQRRRGSGYEAEIPLEGVSGDLLVRGRADGFDPQRMQLEEIKTYRGTFEGIRDNHRSLHWAQAKVYAHLMCTARRFQSIQVALVYFNIATEQETVLVQTCSASDLQNFFVLQCQRFLAWAQQEALHRIKRNEALLALPFPMQQFRAGQKELAASVFRLARNASTTFACTKTHSAAGACLMAQAPTGIGKTLGTIFPALKAMPAAQIDKLFFLTAKNTGHAMAVRAVEKLKIRGQSLPVRVLVLTARDKVCVHPDKACHGDACPLAQGFYDRLPQARTAAMTGNVVWDAETLGTIAAQNQVCPYYLSQELARWCDIAVADYHYYYDSAAMLYALSQAQGWRSLVLVDEAHNLLERARDMYSAVLQPVTLQQARKAAQGNVRKSLNSLLRQWKAVGVFQPTESAERASIEVLSVSSSYCALRKVPKPLAEAVAKAVSAIAQWQSDQPLPPGDPVLLLYWELLQFQAMEEAFGTHSFFDVTVATTAGANLSKARKALPKKAAAATSELFGALDDSAQEESVGSNKRRNPHQAMLPVLAIRNVVPGPHLRQRHASAHASAFFSGTLSPPTFYRDLLGLPEDTGWLDVAAPFHAKQLDVQIASHISTRWHDRQASLSKIAQLIEAQYRKLPGNYLCFVSSFDYLRQLAEALHLYAPQLSVWSQEPGMDAMAREGFLARFKQGGQGIGLAVLGGAFSEGVDLPGSRLIGAFVATLGLPQVNAVNDSMQRVLAEWVGAGLAYDYCYLYPGLRKVVQAAGRVIRTETDCGTVVLMDDRYQQPHVQALLPAWWKLPSA